MEQVQEEKKYVYIFVRKDISLEQQLVQAAHAALEAGFTFQKPKNTAFLVLIAVETQEKLLKTADTLEKQGIKTVLFFEPDDNMGYSAFATEPIDENNRRPFRRFRLWKQ